MAKAIAIIEKPNSCEECWFIQCRYSTPLSTNRKGYLCQLLKGEKRVVEDFDYDEEVHLKNCPLRECPPKKEEFEMDIIHHESLDLGKRIGYNACIDEILRGVASDES